MRPRVVRAYTTRVRRLEVQSGVPDVAAAADYRPEGLSRLAPLHRLVRRYGSLYTVPAA